MSTANKPAAKDSTPSNDYNVEDVQASVRPLVAAKEVVISFEDGVVHVWSAKSFYEVMSKFAANKHERIVCNCVEHE
jgi:hypothetical protein